MDASFDEIEILELYEDRAIQIWHAIQRFGKGGLFDFIQSERELRHGEGGRRRVTVAEDRSWYQPINITMETAGRTEPQMQFVAPAGMARAEAAVLPTNKEFVDRFITQAIWGGTNEPSRGSPGRALFELLLPDHLKERTQDDRHLRLILDADCAAYPWELMDDRRPWDDDSALIAARDRLPLALRAGMIRQLIRQSFRQRFLQPQKGKALVIGDPRGDPTGHFHPLQGAIDEAEAVADLLEGDGRFMVTRLIGDRVTADQVVMQLCAQDWRIIHFATHGVLAGKDSKAMGIVLGREMILTADMLRRLLPFSPELVFVNCCHLGKIEPNRARSNPHAFAASIAAGLIEMSISAVIAAGWAVDDQAAQCFALNFYRQALADNGFGDAVLAARQETHRNYSTSTTWGAYQCYGEPDWRLFSRSRKASTGRLKFASVVELINKVDRICQDAQTGMVRDRKQQLKYLEDVSEEAANRGWSANPDVLTAFGAAYGELGELERACASYEKAIAAERGRTPLRTIEQLANLRLRAALQHPRKGEQDYKKIAEESLLQLKSLAALAGDTLERWSLQGACYKRLAQVTTGAERDNELMDMAEAYRKADERARKKGKLDSYPILMRVAAWVAYNCPSPTPGEVPEELQSLLDDATAAAAKEDAANPSFWSAVAAADALLLRALASGALDASKRKELEEAYLKHWNRGGSWLKFQSVIEQLDFFLDVWDGDAADGSAQPKKRLALREEIVCS